MIHTNGIYGTKLLPRTLEVRGGGGTGRGYEGGLGWVGGRPHLVAYPRSALPSLLDPTGRLYPGVRSQGLPDC